MERRISVVSSAGTTRERVNMARQRARARGAARYLEGLQCGGYRECGGGGGGEVVMVVGMCRPTSGRAVAGRGATRG